jgi:predicted TIM-barrel fold metal-dependent hydrolase
MEQVRRSLRGLIDVHHHVVPPFYLSEYRDRIASSRGGRISPAWLEWTPDRALKEMDRYSIDTAVVSLSTPGIWFGEPQGARDAARRCNEYSADLARRHARRFGRFATIPLPDVDGSLREIEYACDVLGAEGVGVLTSYEDRWLGHPDYTEVFDELNRRKAVVFVHPTSPTCCQNLMPEIAPLMAEVPHDTARAVISLLVSGTLNRNRNIQFIFAHAGGTLPMIAGRIAHYGPPQLATHAVQGIDYELRRLNYDIAGTAYGPAVAALKKLVPVSQILVGSDYPYVPIGDTVDRMHALDFTRDEIQAIGRDNALRLLPGLCCGQVHRDSSQ